jgi:sugar lactone lactonase YvrE
MTAVECIFKGGHALGEGPAWNASDRCIWWVDIRGPALHALDPATGAHRSWPMPQPIGSFAFHAKGGLLVALGISLDVFHPETGVFEPQVRLAGEPPGNRLNDGKCDRQGRFWVGTMRDGGGAAAGTLYRLTAANEATPVRRGVAIPNSLAFAPDGRTMYFTDTADGRILAFDYDPATGEASGEHEFADRDAAPARPDGSTVDAEGCLWNARYGGSCVVRLTPDGRLDRRIDLPVSQVTACAFGGPGLDTLFITTAAQNLTEDARRAEPLAGGLFACRPGVAGLPETPFAG